MGGTRQSRAIILVKLEKNRHQGSVVCRVSGVSSEWRAVVEAFSKVQQRTDVETKRETPTHQIRILLIQYILSKTESSVSECR